MEKVFAGGWLSNIGPQANELNQNNNSCVVSKKFENGENGKVTVDKEVP